MIDFIKNVQRKVYDTMGRDIITGLPLRACVVEKLGGTHGGWNIPKNFNPKIAYCVGAGEEVSFDLALATRGSAVYTFDPTPRAIEYCRQFPELHFKPYGVWSENITKRFYVPKNPKHVSHSILNLQKTNEYFDAECKTIKSIMREYGHTQIDLLKLDIEGAEYAVIDSLIQDRIFPTVLCVEFDELHTHIDSGERKRIQNSAKKLVRVGYILISADRSDFTFLKQ